MRKSVLVAALVAGILGTAASATTFLFSFGGGLGLNGASGSLEATANGNGTFTATSGTILGFGSSYAGGTAGATGTLIANPSAPGHVTSPGGGWVYDDQIFPNPANPLITNYGLFFSVGSYEVNIFSNGPGPGTYSLQSGGNGALSNEARGDFALTQVAGAVPEAATWAMMVAGFGLVGVSARRRARITVAA